MPSSATTRALVLGGGGLAGIAWEIGVLCGLADEGLDVSGADLVVGTSAGSVVGALVRQGMALAEMFAAQSDEAGEVGADVAPERLAELFAPVMAMGSASPEERRAAIGRIALDAPTAPEAERRAIVAGRLTDHVWPERPLKIVVVEAETGEERVFQRADGVGLVDAIAASCAVPGLWPPMTVDGRRYMDGGVRSLTNADLAAGHDAILVVAPFPDLREFELPGMCKIEPDDASREAIGFNPFDPATREPSARAGREQGRREAAFAAAVWNG